MDTSLFLARLIGPVLVVVGIGLLARPGGWRAIAEEFLASPALIFVAGLLALVPGLAIVLTHNVWALDWRLIVTLLGWLSVIGGILRILFPGEVRGIGKAMLKREGRMRGGGAVTVVLGLVLAYFGYISTPAP